MGKRSNFERREAVVVPLIPYLRGIRSFAEPCAGDGALVRHLESSGLRREYVGDTAAAKIACDRPLRRRRNDHHEPALHPELMHRLIAHFQRTAPTWLLLESDWASTREAKSA